MIPSTSVHCQIFRLPYCPAIGRWIPYLASLICVVPGSYTTRANSTSTRQFTLSKSSPSVQNPTDNPRDHMTTRSVRATRASVDHKPARTQRTTCGTSPTSASRDPHRTLGRDGDYHLLPPKSEPREVPVLHARAVSGYCQVKLW